MKNTGIKFLKKFNTVNARSELKLNFHFARSFDRKKQNTTHKKALSSSRKGGTTKGKQEHKIDPTSLTVGELRRARK